MICDEHEAIGALLPTVLRENRTQTLVVIDIQVRAQAFLSHLLISDANNIADDWKAKLINVERAKRLMIAIFNFYQKSTEKSPQESGKIMK